MTLGGSLGRWTASSERKVTPGSPRTPLQWAAILEQSPWGAAQCPAPAPQAESKLSACCPSSSPPLPPPPSHTVQEQSPQAGRLTPQLSHKGQGSSVESQQLTTAPHPGHGGQAGRLPPQPTNPAPSLPGMSNRDNLDGFSTSQLHAWGAAWECGAEVGGAFWKDSGHCPSSSEPMPLDYVQSLSRVPLNTRLTGPSAGPRCGQTHAGLSVSAAPPHPVPALRQQAPVIIPVSHLGNRGLNPWGPADAATVLPLVPTSQHL